MTNSTILNKFSAWVQLMTNPLYYSLRNLIYYRKEQQIAPTRHYILHQKLLNCKSLNQADQVKQVFTDCCLATVGLTTVENETETIPRYILLSKVQKNWIKSVSENGYRVGLT